jgi:nitroreductase
MPVLKIYFLGGIVDTLETIKNRRAIRKYKADPVDDKTLEIVLDAARLAPSWANTQCWKFIVIRDTAARAQLAETLTRPNPELAANPALNAIINAPVVIVACAEMGKSGFREGQPATDKGEYWFMFDVALAMQNLALAAHSLGLGTVNVGGLNAKKVEDILRVPEGVRVVELTPLGYPDGAAEGTTRKELREIVFYEKYGQQ